MKIRILIISFLVIVYSGCEQNNTDLEALKKELKTKREKLREMQESVKELEEKIAALDPAFARKNKKATLITTVPVKRKRFVHYVEISGAVRSKKNVLISAENMGTVVRVLVREGSEVKKGQLLILLDAELYQKQLDQLKTEYRLAKTMYEKQANLWQQKIGTEVQYLQAKNKKESLERQIENVRTQISKSRVRAPFSGTVDEVYVREGEMAQMGSPLVRIVNHKDMYVRADLSESYIGKFKKGDKVIIDFPSLGKTIESRISSVGQVIDPMNRTFSIEAYLPRTDFAVKPNLLVVLKLKDVEVNNAVVIPSKLILNDNKGEFIYIVEKDSVGQQIARKQRIKRGPTYKHETMILEGLSGDELLIDEGFTEVSDGVKVKVVEKVI